MFMMMPRAFTFTANLLRIENWLWDNHTVAGETFKQWFKDILQNNLLIKNLMTVGKEITDLSKINSPVLTVVGTEDRLIPPECSVPLNDLVSSKEKRLMYFQCGHVGLICSSYSQNNVLPKIVQWIRYHKG